MKLQNIYTLQIQNHYFFKLTFLLYIIFTFIINNNDIYNYSNLSKKVELYNNSTKFVIIQKKISYSPRGLMSYYYHNLGCAIEYILKGYIPIIDLASHPNMFNGFNITKDYNPWEKFFDQPFDLTLNEVLNKSNNVTFVDCDMGRITPDFYIYYSYSKINLWHNLAKTYMPIKKEFIREANNKYRILFGRSNNVLGVLVRGTDYTARKSKGHPIQPSAELVMEDITKMDNKYKYDFIFLTTEDENIRRKIIGRFDKKIKYNKSKINLNYDYNKKELLVVSNNNIGNINFTKIYLINIIILSKCIDVIVSRTGGSLVAFILSNGFRHIKAYNLGLY